MEEKKEICVWPSYNRLKRRKSIIVPNKHADNLLFFTHAHASCRSIHCLVEVYHYLEVP